MTSGYLMTGERFERGVADFDGSATAHDWPFLALKDQMCDANTDPKDLKAVLRTGKSMWFKPWIVSLGGARWTMLLALLLVLIPILVLCAAGLVLTLVAGVAVGVANVWSAVGRWRHQKPASGRRTTALDAVQRVFLGSLLATAGALVAWVYIKVFDPHYLEAGRIE